MTIAYVGSTQTYFNTNANTRTISYAAGSGTNRGLMLYIMTNDSGGDALNGAGAAVTYAGVSATRVFAFDTLQAGQHVWMYGYRLENPTSGTNNYIVTLETGVSTDFQMGVLEYTGVDQTNMTDGFNTVTLTTSSATATITTTVNNDWLTSAARAASTGNAIAGTNVTQRQPNSGSLFGMGDTNAAQTPAGAFVQNWTCASGAVTVGAIAIKPAGAAPTVNSNFLMFM